MSKGAELGAWGACSGPRLGPVSGCPAPVDGPSGHLWPSMRECSRGLCSGRPSITRSFRSPGHFCILTTCPAGSAVAPWVTSDATSRDLRCPPMMSENAGALHGRYADLVHVGRCSIAQGASPRLDCRIDWLSQGRRLPRHCRAHRICFDRPLRCFLQRSCVCHTSPTPSLLET